jgi:hypothetical protein
MGLLLENRNFRSKPATWATAARRLRRIADVDAFTGKSHLDGSNLALPAGP